MKLVDNTDNYNVVAKFLHWTMAVLIIANYIIGLTLDDSGWYFLHKQIGLTILFMVILRILWRMVSKYPKPLATISASEAFAAKLAQLVLYGLMLAIPISGILVVEAAGYPLVIYGLVKFPSLILKEAPDIAQVKVMWHLWLAHTIIILAAGHALIALIHHYLIKDRLLLRMLPGRKT